MSCSHRKGLLLERYHYYRYQGAASAGPDPQSHKLNKNCISHPRRAFKMMGIIATAEGKQCIQYFSRSISSINILTKQCRIR